MSPNNDLWFRSLVQAQSVGLKTGIGSAHASKTIMLADLSRLLEPGCNNQDLDFRSHIIDANILGKQSHAARQKSLSYLSQLHGFGTGEATFRALTALWPNAKARPMLAAMSAVVIGNAIRKPEVRT